MPDIKQLMLAELKQIYQEYVKQDFPLMELRPWFAVERALKRGEYAAYGYYDGERFLAYATFYSCGEDPHILMDYFAVVPELRGRGLGSSFLGKLRPLLTAADGIFIEAERADGDIPEEERAERRRRIAFYRANGAVTTGVGCHLFGVDYQILYLPTGSAVTGGEEFYEAVCSLYRELYRPVYGTLCKPCRKEP